ncbi:Methyltransferase [Aspergillus sclerotialis]|uniref:Methyltransferase n=1 Tax=Aspergillus sclerotialis TaxID=2070753 RepID=A0A3A2Z585_9EURO|nr:Methyltransferase [Aspergillus sclerotialis]
MAKVKSSTSAPGSSSLDPTDIIVPDDEVDYQTASPDNASETGSSSYSLSSSVVNYTYENGRRYHAYREGAYFAPNDEQEQARMDLLQHIIRIVLKGDLFLAPIGPNPERVLDLGTGTGIWAINMADEFPKATVTGIDLSPIQSNWIPPNCYFQVDDFESPWDFWDFKKPFDFIHAGNLAGSVKDVPNLLQRAKDTLRPGGWFEFVDFAPEPFADDDTLNDAKYFREWSKLCDEASIKFGKRMNVTSFYKQWMIDAGYKDVNEVVHKVPVGRWPKDPKLKELGEYFRLEVLESLEAYSFALMTRVLGWSIEEVQAFLTELRSEINNRKLHIYSKLYIVYGRKPETGEN